MDNTEAHSALIIKLLIDVSAMRLVLTRILAYEALGMKDARQFLESTLSDLHKHLDQLALSEDKFFMKNSERTKIVIDDIFAAASKTLSLEAAPKPKAH